MENNKYNPITNRDAPAVEHHTARADNRERAKAKTKEEAEGIGLAPIDDGKCEEGEPSTKQQE